MCILINACSHIVLLCSTQLCACRAEQNIYNMMYSNVDESMHWFFHVLALPLREISAPHLLWSTWVCAFAFLIELVRRILGLTQDRGVTTVKSNSIRMACPSASLPGSLAINCPLGIWACQPPVIASSRFPWIPHPGHRWDDNSSEAFCTNIMAGSSVKVSLISYQREIGFYGWFPKPTLIKGQKG